MNVDDPRSRTNVPSALSELPPAARSRTNAKQRPPHKITDLTCNPQSEAGKTLLALTNQLTRVKTPEDAGKWLSLLQDWHQVYRDYINEKTYGLEPGTRKWWWTHQRVRKAYKRLERLARSGYLFTWLDPKFTGLDIQRTTSSLEGGVNAAIRRLLNAHRGLSEPHMKTAIEWGELSWVLFLLVFERIRDMSKR